ncbi:aspartate kinase [Thermonema lapsum]|uniref:Aspartokinase n=1 Tax=Thermonema lapsum TaxID=28195 RepID=A0A846MRY6_9BACT|nr:aspartate kinase [Thermonema lapsum]NIK74122.1 aspartate kinase [Thermonema lapsum]
MKVFKFGGASVKDAEAIRNVAHIIQTQGSPRELLVVVSAMGKTTNALEKLLDNYFAKKDYEQDFRTLYDYHMNAARALFPEGHPAFQAMERLFVRLRYTLLHHTRPENYHESYDQVVSFGELLSSTLISHFLQSSGIAHRWIDARDYIKTDTSWRKAQVDWAWSEHLIQTELRPVLQEQIVVTQGFIGGTLGGRTTTLGREGSDYSAALFAAALNAESVTVWKDVPGVLNADPKHYAFASLFEHLSYRQAAEMTFYGASVIHPNTIRPLASKNIPLLVRSFLTPTKNGTRIDAEGGNIQKACVIRKENQCLVSFAVKDLAFITEERISYVLDACHRLHLKLNLIQSSALSLSVCFDDRPEYVEELRQLLQEDFSIAYNKNLLLITILNYDSALYEEVKGKRPVILQQATRKHIRFLVPMDES